MIINFPVWVKTTKCEATSRTKIETTRHGVVKTTEQVKR